MVANFEESELPYAVQIEDATGEVIWECSISEGSRQADLAVAAR
jgi:hypothetical protein